MRNPDIGKSSEIGSEPEQTPLSSEVKKLSKEKFQKQILEPLKLCGLMMEIEEGSLGEKSVEGVLLRSFEEGEIESILFSDLTILQACVQFLIKNKTEASSITEKVQSAIFTSKEEKEQITLFVNRAINLAFDVPVQDLYSIKADELKSVTPLSHFQEEEALSSMSLDNIERKEGQEALAFIHQRKAEEGSIILSIGRVETAIQILTDQAVSSECFFSFRAFYRCVSKYCIYGEPKGCCFRPNSTRWPRCSGTKRADLLNSQQRYRYHPEERTERHPESGITLYFSLYEAALPSKREPICSRASIPGVFSGDLSKSID
ncbi:hypothetical protein ACTFIY_004619 [Dictyostelium cf. discoideum]